MKYLPLLLVFFLFGCSPLSNLQKLQHPNHTILSPKKERPATVYFPNVVPISKPYVKGPILTERFVKRDLEIWADKLSKLAAEKTFDAVIVINQISGSYAPSNESAVFEPYIMITYMGVWYAVEEYFPINIMKSVRYYSHSLQGQVHVATASFDLGGKLLDVEGKRDEYEWFQSWQGWYYAGYTHDNWYRSADPTSQNFRVDKSNPQYPVIYDHYQLRIFGDQMTRDALKIHNRNSNIFSFVSMLMLDHGPQTEFFEERKTIYRSEFGIDGMGRIISQEIYLVTHIEVLIATAEYEYYRFEDLPEEYIVRPAITGI